MYENTCRIQHTGLTLSTLIKFADKINAVELTDEQCKKVEYCAYVANMGAKSQAKADERFEELLCEYVPSLFRGQTEEEEEEEEAQNVEMIRAEVEAIKDRSAWDKGVQGYALSFLDDLGEAVSGGYVEDADLLNPAKLKEALLNGARDWKQYSWGGSSLCCDWQIARQLCTASKLKKTNNGEKRPNASEEWLDVQARALYQAWRRIENAARKVSKMKEGK